MYQIESEAMISNVKSRIIKILAFKLRRLSDIHDVNNSSLCNKNVLKYTHLY